MRASSLCAEAVLTEWLDVGLDALTGSFVDNLTGPSLQAGEWSPPKDWRGICAHCCLLKVSEESAQNIASHMRYGGRKNVFTVCQLAC